MSILISSTSYLPTDQKIWKNLSLLTKKITFNEYANLHSGFNHNYKIDYSIFIIFFHDLLGINANEKVKIFLKNLEEYLKKYNSNVLVALSNYDGNNNVIENAKNLIINKKIANNFKKNIYKLTTLYNNLLFVDLDLPFSYYGYKEIFDSRNWYTYHMRISYKTLSIIDKEIYQVIYRNTNTNKKVLILDCDNTLWGGVVGEIGWENLELGEEGIGNAFREFQREIKSIQKKGILIGLCSKNNESDVWEAFKKNNYFLLKRNDFTFAKINWKEKTNNILNISKELNLGLESFVFWDDNPLERDKVKNSLPEVEVFDVPEDITLWPYLIRNYYGFSKFSISQSDKKKSSQYKKRGKFLNLKNKIKNENLFIKQLKLIPKIIKVTKKTSTRASELTLKTNQFNIRSQRYTEKDITNLIRSKSHELYLCSVKDIYGDHGIIGLAILELKKKDAFLDTFLFSCRILGRKVEYWFFQNILNILKLKKFQKLEIEFLSTGKNDLIKSFLTDLKIPIKNRKKNNFHINTNNKIINIKKLYE